MYMVCFGFAGSDSARVVPRRTDRGVRADRSGFSRFTICVTTSSSAAVRVAGDSGRRSQAAGRGVDWSSIHMSNDRTKNRQRVCQRSGEGPSRNCPDTVNKRRGRTTGIGTRRAMRDGRQQRSAVGRQQTAGCRGQRDRVRLRSAICSLPSPVCSSLSSTVCSYLPSPSSSAGRRSVTTRWSTA